ncbi:divergent polysaccharide deacetylase family protein [Parvibaculum sp.]|uniref:divergent polysaccharide deacetylase family protein n=1 Tax=Parvibaculum sp. TaxID=2024848 RepID=UPI00320F9D93
MPRNPLSAMTGDETRRPGLLAIAAIIVALVFGGTLGWLFLSDHKLAGEPVVRLAVAPEPAQPPAPPAELRPSNPDETPAAPKAGTTLPDPDQPSADEQALLDAAKRVEQGDEPASADGVRIVGAESAPSDDNTPAPDAIGPLRPAPDPALVANGTQGPLPVISKDGRQAWKVYARPLPKGLPDGPRVAVVVSGMGISESATAHAIEVLPPEVTLSFAPYGARLQEWIGKARAAGHEVLLELPMEPFGYPQNDPGPYTLLTNLQAPENISRLEWQMSRFAGYAGVMNYQGARFTSAADALSPILAALKSRGLMYVDNGTSQRSLAPKLGGEIGLPVAQGTRMIDPVQNPDVIKQSLSMLEDSAKQSGLAVGIASAFPVTVDEVARWAEGLKGNGVVLVPVTATAHGPK